MRNPRELLNCTVCLSDLPFLETMMFHENHGDL